MDAKEKKLLLVLSGVTKFVSMELDKESNIHYMNCYVEFSDRYPVDRIALTGSTFWIPMTKDGKSKKSHSFRCKNVVSSLGWWDVLTAAGSKALDLSQKFELLQLIGKGAFASVYNARDLQHLQSVVVKHISLSRLDENNLRAEIAFTIACSSPYVLKFYEAYVTKENIILILEYLPGGDVLKSLAQRGTYNEWEAKKLLFRLLSGLALLHSQGVIHRDIKPENIGIVTEGDRTRIKILDFGLSARINSSLASNRCGSAGYIAPEILSSLFYDNKVDVFSCGATLFLILSGHPAFDAADVNSVLKSSYCRLEDFENSNNYYWSKRKDCANMWEYVSLAGKMLLLRLLRPNPRERPSAKEALEDPWFDDVRRDLLRECEEEEYRRGDEKRLDEKKGESEREDRRERFVKSALEIDLDTGIRRVGAQQAASGIMESSLSGSLHDSVKRLLTSGNVDTWKRMDAGSVYLSSVGSTGERKVLENVRVRKIANQLKKDAISNVRMTIRKVYPDLAIEEKSDRENKGEARDSGEERREVGKNVRMWVCEPLKFPSLLEGGKKRKGEKDIGTVGEMVRGNPMLKINYENGLICAVEKPTFEKIRQELKEKTEEILALTPYSWERGEERKDRRGKKAREMLLRWVFSGLAFVAYHVNEILAFLTHDEFDMSIMLSSSSLPPVSYLFSSPSPSLISSANVESSTKETVLKTSHANASSPNIKAQTGIPDKGTHLYHSLAQSNIQEEREESEDMEESFIKGQARDMGEIDKQHESHSAAVRTTIATTTALEGERRTRKSTEKITLHEFITGQRSVSSPCESLHSSSLPHVHQTIQKMKKDQLARAQREKKELNGTVNILTVSKKAYPDGFLLDSYGGGKEEDKREDISVIKEREIGERRNRGLDEEDIPGGQLEKGSIEKKGEKTISTTATMTNPQYCIFPVLYESNLHIRSYARRKKLIEMGVPLALEPTIESQQPLIKTLKGRSPRHEIERERGLFLQKKMHGYKFDEQDSRFFKDVARKVNLMQNNYCCLLDGDGDLLHAPFFYEEIFDEKVKMKKRRHNMAPPHSWRECSQYNFDRPKDQVYLSKHALKALEYYWNCLDQPAPRSKHSANHCAPITSPPSYNPDLVASSSPLSLWVSQQSMSLNDSNSTLSSISLSPSLSVLSPSLSLEKEKDETCSNFSMCVFTSSDNVSYQRNYSMPGYFDNSPTRKFDANNQAIINNSDMKNSPPSFFDDYYI